MSMRAMQVPVVFVVYPSEFGDMKRFTAHCLNLDVIADDETVEGAFSNLLETVEHTIEVCEEHNANPFKDAPKEYWDKLKRAQSIPKEMAERVILQANKGVAGRKACAGMIDVRGSQFLEVLQTT